ncbi:MAG: DNA primase [Chloroflexi bacterium]|nr:MAG: DNA primase [Chloroflexota bacterium]
MPQVKQDAVQEIKDRLDLVDLISEHLRLQKAGRDQKGGDHFTFIQDIEHVDFRGALRLLAEKTGVVLEESPGAGRQRELKRTIARLNLLAAQYFHHILLENPTGQRALIQLESRGVTRASMTEFQLGFAPAGQRKDNLVRFLRKHGASDGEMQEAGLAIKPDGGGELWDRFRQRIIIPIHDEHGELVAFGGRVIDDTAQPKYLNTSQTALYDKGRTLFNLHRARKSIHELKHAVLMEGYFDAITAWQANVTNVVTTSGTALGEHQVRLLKRETQELVLAFDRDDAGLNATQRAIELATKSGIYIKVVRVPQGKDPDDYLRAHPDGWANLREHALPEWEYLLRQALASLDLTDARERRRGAELVIPVLAKIPEASVLEIYAQQAAGWLRIEPAALLRDVQGLKSGAKFPARPVKFSSQSGSLPSPLAGEGWSGGGAGGSKDEGYLLGLLIERPDLVPEIAGELQAVSFSAPAYERVFARLQQMVEAQATVRPTDRLSEFAPDEQGLISAVAMAKYPELDSGSEAALRQSLEQCLQTLKINAAQRRLKALVAEMRAARATGDESRLVTLMQENDRLAHQLDALKDLRHGQG